MEELNKINLFDLYEKVYYYDGLNFLWFNFNEKYLRYSDYGITKSEVDQYVNGLKERFEYVNTQATVIRRRFDFLKVAFVVLLIIVGCIFTAFIIELSNEYINGLILIYVSFAILIGKGFVFAMECTQNVIINNLIDPYKNPPEYDARIWKYMIDLYWIKSAIDIEEAKRRKSKYSTNQ